MDGWELWTECLGWNPNNTVNWIQYNNGGAGYPQFLSFVQHFYYDNLNRLTGANDTPPSGSPTNWARTFNYDQWGNMWVTNGTGTTPTSNIYLPIRIRTGGMGWFMTPAATYRR